MCVEEFSILVNLHDRRLSHPPSQRSMKRFFLGGVKNGGMGAMPVIGGNLDRKLASPRDEREQARDESPVVFNPVQGRVGDDEVPCPPHLLDGPLCERDAGAGKGGTLPDHVRRTVDALHHRSGQTVGKPGRQLSGTTSQVDDAQTAPDPDERERSSNGAKRSSLNFRYCPGSHGMSLLRIFRRVMSS